MAYLQFGRQQYFRVLDTGAEASMGSFQVSEGMELESIVLDIFVRGVITTPYTLTVRLYSGQPGLVNPTYVSDPFTCSMDTLFIENKASYTTNWIGFVPINFSGFPVSSAKPYFATLQASNDYVKSDNSYVSFNLDWSSPVNNQITSGLAGARMRILGLK